MFGSQLHKLLALISGLIFLAACNQAMPQPSAPTLPALSSNPSIVISQVYGSGNIPEATYQYDFVELFNRSNTAVNLDSYSIQYASATGTGLFSANSPFDLPNFNLQPGQYYLVRFNGGTNFGAPLPTPDASASGPNLSGSNGKVILANVTTGLACNGSSSQPCDSTQIGQIVDLVGYGSANFFEGSAAVFPLGAATAAVRAGNGCTDTNQNGTDFSAATPTPRNSSSSFNVCSSADNPPTVSSTNPTNGATGVALSANITITFSEAVTADSGAFALSCNSTSKSFGQSGGPTTFTLNPDTDFSTSQNCTVTVTAANITDQDGTPNPMAANYIFSFTTAAPPTPIRDIQGSGHTSPLVGQSVTTTGIVTAKSNNGFYLQDPNPDANDATSEALLVFTSSNPTVNVGDSVSVSGTVTEFRPGGSSSVNLTITEITSPTVSILSSGNPLPAATVIGTGGRIPPSSVIDDDGFATFDPANDGIDFYESLEHMRVQINNAVAVSPRNNFNEVWVLPDNGSNASVRTSRSGIVIRSTDFNPERVQIDDTLLSNSVPAVNVGDTFSTALVGVLDYNFNNYELLLTTAASANSGGLSKESTALQGSTTRLSVATFNVENLDPGDGATKFNNLANAIVNNLNSPDIIALEEIQDNNGPTNDSVVDASNTFTTLINAIVSAGGPTYSYRQINPTDDQDGGEPGGNIRVGFLYNASRVSFVDRAGGTATANTTVNNVSGQPQLSFSPGRLDPTNSAFSSSRKPLAGEFVFRNQTVFVIANHFNSKGGDNPLFGRYQPPVLSSEAQRNQQATVVRDFVQSILAVDANANVVVLGDINDFEFSTPMNTLKQAPLTALIEGLPQAERYTYIFEGNSQALDHILVSSALNAKLIANGYDIVHINSEFSDQISDHDPQVAVFSFNRPPSLGSVGPFSVGEGSSSNLSASANDPENDSLSYAWDLDNNGSYETAGQNVSFSAANIDGPATRTVGVQVTDTHGATATATATVNILNIAPTVNPLRLSANPLALNQNFSVSASFSDAFANDGPFTCQINYGLGASVSGTIRNNTCTGPSTRYTQLGTYNINVTIIDSDGGSTTRTLRVNLTFSFNRFLNFAALPTFNSIALSNPLNIDFSLNSTISPGLSILANGYPQSVRIACPGQFGTFSDQAPTFGNLTTTFNGYRYAWNTNPAWAGQCRQFILQLTDGTTHRLNFQFR